MITCITATFLVLFVDYKYVEKYGDFVSVDAVITDIRREVTYHGESQKTSYDILVRYKYSYDAASLCSLAPARRACEADESLRC